MCISSSFVYNLGMLRIWEQGMELQAGSTAVLVIDELVVEGDDTLYNQSPEERRTIDQSVKVVDAARKAGMAVIFCDDAHILGLDKELDLWGEHGIAGRAIPNPLLQAGSSPKDFIIPKRRYSGFFETDLDLTLRELGVTTLIVVGEDTNICVLHTLADAFYRGYETIVVEDATRTFLCGTQAGALEHFERCFGSQILSTDDIVNAIHTIHVPNNV